MHGQSLLFYNSDETGVIAALRSVDPWCGVTTPIRPSSRFGTGVAALARHFASISVIPIPIPTPISRGLCSSLARHGTVMTLASSFVQPPSPILWWKPLIERGENARVRVKRHAFKHRDGTFVWTQPTPPVLAFVFCILHTSSMPAWTSLS